MYTLKPNGDIVENEQSVVYDEKLRAYRVTIELPQDGAYTIIFDVEKIKRANGMPVVSVNDGQVNRAFSQVMAETQTIVDPVTGQNVTISTAGIAVAIQTAFTRWLFQDKGYSAP